MEIGDIHVSTDIVYIIVLALLYSPVLWLCCRRLMPCFSRAAWRLATLLLAAQVLVIGLSLGVQTSSPYERWLWHLHEEWNIPATLAAVQLAVVGGVALLTSCVAKPRARPRQLYLAAMGLIFLFLAMDEFLAIHEFIRDWEERYLLLGAAISSATLLLALRSPRVLVKWHILLLAGLALSAAGALLVNAIPIPCDIVIGMVRLDGCLKLYILEEAMEFLGIWLALLAMLGFISTVAPSSSRGVSRLLYGLPAFALLALLMNAFAPRLELPLLARPAAVRFESGLHIHGYRVDHRGGGGDNCARIRFRQSSGIHESGLFCSPC